MLSLRFIQQASAVCRSRSSYMQFHIADLSLQYTTLQAALIHSQRSVSGNRYSLIFLQTARETSFPPGYTSEQGHSSHPPITYIHTHFNQQHIPLIQRGGSGINATSAPSLHYSTFFSPSTQGLLGVFPPLYRLLGLGDPAGVRLLPGALCGARGGTRAQPRRAAAAHEARRGQRSRGCAPGQALGGVGAGAAAIPPPPGQRP